MKRDTIQTLQRHLPRNIPADPHPLFDQAEAAAETNQTLTDIRDTLRTVVETLEGIASDVQWASRNLKSILTE